MVTIWLSSAAPENFVGAGHIAGFLRSGNCRSLSLRRSRFVRRTYLTFLRFFLLLTGIRPHCRDSPVSTSCCTGSWIEFLYCFDGTI